MIYLKTLNSASLHKDVPKTKDLAFAVYEMGSIPRFLVRPANQGPPVYVYIIMTKVLTTIMVFCLLAHLCADAQSYDRADIVFFSGQDPLPNAFAGGLRAPQFSTADLNMDGIDDLVVFEREGQIVLPFLTDPDNPSIKIHAPEYRSRFPPVSNWLLMRDFDRDGIADIFCSPTQSAVPGVEVWKGVVTDGEIEYRLETFPERDFNILYVPIGSGQSQIFVSVVDLPDIRDIDNDGDLDVLAFEPSGTTVFFYRNMQVEHSLDPEILEFKLEDPCYGKFLESGFSQEIILSTDANQCASFLLDPDNPLIQTRHAGSTVTAFDVDENGLADLLLGDISFNGLVFLENQGTLENAWMSSSSSSFPGGDGTPVSIEIFNSAFFENVDNQSDTELLVAPNDRFASQNTDHVWKFKRSDELDGSYELISKNYLVDEMVHTGENSSPQFFDYNTDGLLDVILGTSGFSPDGISRNPALVLYENKGTASHPEFHLIDEDYLGMSAFSGTSRNFSPAFGDIDGDEDPDLVIGDDAGRLYYLENTGVQSGTVRFAAPVYNAFQIKVSAWARPTIFDFNGDGLGDLILGEQNFNSSNGIRGSLNYFQNQGIAGSASFDPDVGQSPNEAIFGRVNTKETGFINNYSAPKMFSSDQVVLLAVGTESGLIHLYEASSQEPADSMLLVSNSLGMIDEGNLTVVDFADIDADGLYEMAVGTRRGGLAILNTDLVFDRSVPVTETGRSEDVIIYPNPGSRTIHIRMQQALKNAELTIMRYDGSTVASYRLGDSDSLTVDLIPPGYYFILIREGQRQWIQPWIKH